MKHPYEEYEGTVLWESVTKAINDLIENQDLELKTSKEYVIGYICMEINKKKRRIIFVSFSIKHPISHAVHDCHPSFKKRGICDFEFLLVRCLDFCFFSLHVFVVR